MKNETLDIILHLGTHNTTHYKQTVNYNKWMFVWSVHNSVIFANHCKSFAFDLTGCHFAKSNSDLLRIDFFMVSFLLTLTRADNKWYEHKHKVKAWTWLFNLLTVTRLLCGTPTFTSLFYNKSKSKLLIKKCT